MWPDINIEFIHQEYTIFTPVVIFVDYRLLNNDDIQYQLILFSSLMNLNISNNIELKLFYNSNENEMIVCFLETFDHYLKSSYECTVWWILIILTRKDSQIWNTTYTCYFLLRSGTRNDDNWKKHKCLSNEIACSYVLESLQ